MYPFCITGCVPFRYHVIPLEDLEARLLILDVKNHRHITESIVFSIDDARFGAEDLNTPRYYHAIRGKHFFKPAKGCFCQGIKKGYTIESVKAIAFGICQT